MQTYIVHEPPNSPADRVDRAETLVFVRDGFSWGAAVLGPLWLLAHRLWWPLLGYVALAIALIGFRWLLALDEGWATFATAGLHILIGLEAGNLRTWTLERRGWQTLGAVTGRGLADCERRFFANWLPDQPILNPRASGSVPATDSGWRGRLLPSTRS